jgi:hypothetical protein
VTNVELLHRELDATPSDQTLRGALADALLEDGDDRGFGYAALAALGKWPVAYYADTLRRPADFLGHLFTNGEGRVDKMYSDDNDPHPWLDGYTPRLHMVLPQVWYSKVGETDKGILYENDKWLGFDHTRRQVEDRVAAAFLRLRKRQRAKLLSAAGVTV